MPDRYNAPDNASVFNLKRAHNGLAGDLPDQRFRNKILNPSFRETRGQNIYAWTGTLNIQVPVSIDTIKGSVTYDFAPGEYIRQALISPALGKSYTAVSDVDTTGAITVSLEGGSEDIFGLDGTENPSEIIDGTGKFALRAKTRLEGVDSTTRWNDTLYIYYRNDTTAAVRVTFKFVSVVYGLIAITGHEGWSSHVRFNDATDAEFWEVTLDGRQTWTRLWEEGQDFTDRVGFIVQEQTVDLVHQDNIIGGTDITIEYGVLVDGTTPTVIINSSASGSGGGTGDWTREDVTYQGLLEHSDFNYSTYDSLILAATTSGSASYTGVIDDFGAGSLFGPGGADIITKNLIQEIDSSAHTLFYFHAQWAGSGYNLEYAVGSDGTTFGSWVSCLAEEAVIVPGGFNYLRFRLAFTGQTSVYSFGVLYGNQMVSAGTQVGFLERYTQVGAGSVNDIVEIPNGKWYHLDGMTLNVYYNRAKLIEGIDYNEYNVGFSEKSNAIEMLFEMDDEAEIIFQEYYGYVDISEDNTQRLDTDHWPTGHHKNDLGIYYLNDATGDDSNDGLTPETSWQTLDFAMDRLDGVGGTRLWLGDDGNFSMAESHDIQSTLLDIRRLGDGINPPIVTMESAYDGTVNWWGGFALYNGSFTSVGVDWIIDHPFVPSEPDHEHFHGIPYRNGQSEGTVRFNQAEITVRGASLFECGVWGQNIDYNFAGDCEIIGERTYRPSVPIINFNDSIGGLYDQNANTTFSGDATGGWDVEVTGLLRTAGITANIRTNIPELYTIEDEDGSGNRYTISVDAGQLILKPVL